MQSDEAPRVGTFAWDCHCCLLLLLGLCTTHVRIVGTAIAFIHMETPAAVAAPATTPPAPSPAASMTLRVSTLL